MLCFLRSNLKGWVCSVSLGKLPPWRILASRKGVTRCLWVGCYENPYPWRVFSDLNPNSSQFSFSYCCITFSYSSKPKQIVFFFKSRTKIEINKCILWELWEHLQAVTLIQMENPDLESITSGFAGSGIGCFRNLLPGPNDCVTTASISQFGATRNTDQRLWGQRPHTPGNIYLFRWSSLTLNRYLDYATYSQQPWTGQVSWPISDLTFINIKRQVATGTAVPKSVSFLVFIWGNRYTSWTTSLNFGGSWTIFLLCSGCIFSRPLALLLCWKGFLFQTWTLTFFVDSSVVRSGCQRLLGVTSDIFFWSVAKGLKKSHIKGQPLICHSGKRHANILSSSMHWWNRMLFWVFHHVQTRLFLAGAKRLDLSPAEMTNLLLTTFLVL